MYRNNLILKHSLRAIDVAYKKGHKIIAEGGHDFSKPYSDMDKISGSGIKMLFDFRKWTYKQFYPGWEE